MKKTIITLSILMFMLSSITLVGADSKKEEKSKFKLSFTERIRLTTWDNAITLSKQAGLGSTFLRVRTGIMGKYLPSKSFELGIRVTNEFRKYLVPEAAEFHFNEVFLDQFYAKWNMKNILPATLTLGRQNIILGEGFVVLDGNPLDGSRSIYFNALRFNYKISDKSQLDFFAVYQPDEDKLLPSLNGNDIDKKFQGDGTYQMLEQSEVGFGAYYTGNYSKMNLQTYFINKQWIDADKARNQLNGNVNTLGIRVKYPFSKVTSITAETAYQFGKSDDDIDRSGIGGYAYLNFNLNGKRKYIPKTISLGTVYLSGDDPSTKDIEGWDPVFSRWPKWSESYIYTQILEFGGKVAYWSNYFSIYGKLYFNLFENANLTLDYHLMSALEKPATIIMSTDDNKNRGNLLVAKFKYKINKKLSGHFLWEHFSPGDYYLNSDSSNWIRFELMLVL